MEEKTIVSSGVQERSGESQAETETREFLRNQAETANAGQPAGSETGLPESAQPRGRVRQPGEKIRMVIADDHAILRESLSALLATQPDFEVVGSAANGQEALNLVREKSPDVLILDLFMPDFDGFDVLRTLDRGGSRVATVILTGSENQTDYTQVVKLGGRGLVIKTDGVDRLFEAIRMVAAGDLAFSEDLAHTVVTSMAEETRAQTARASSLSRLSERERQIAYSVARGMKNKDIGQQLHISENTVKRHLQSIFGKTGARDRLELAVLALNEISSSAA